MLLVQHLHILDDEEANITAYLQDEEYKPFSVRKLVEIELEVIDSTNDEQTDTTLNKWVFIFFHASDEVISVEIQTFPSPYHRIHFRCICFTSLLLPVCKKICCVFLCLFILFTSPSTFPLSFS